MRLLPKVRHVVNIQICWKHKRNANKSFAKAGVGSNQLQRKGTFSVRLAYGQKRKKMLKKIFFDCKHKTKSYKILSGLLPDNFTFVFVFSKLMQLVKFMRQSQLK